MTPMSQKNIPPADATTKSRRGGKRPGAGAPLAGEGPSVKMVIRTAPGLGERIQCEATRRGVTVSEIVREALTKHLQSDDRAITLALARGLDAQVQRLAAADMIGADEAAELHGCGVRQVQTLCRTMRIIGLKIPGRVTAWTLPHWQFQEAIIPHIPEIAQALGARDGWAVLRFLEAPLGGLDGLTPREALERGQSDRVLQLAVADTY